MCIDNEPVYIIMELMPAGDLLKFLREARRESVRYYILYIYTCIELFNNNILCTLTKVA